MGQLFGDVWVQWNDSICGRKNYGKDGRLICFQHLRQNKKRERVVVACLPGVFHAIRISGADGHRDGRDSITDSNQLGNEIVYVDVFCAHRHHLMNLVGRTFRPKEWNLEISVFMFYVSILILQIQSRKQKYKRALMKIKDLLHHPADKMATIQSRQQRPQIIGHHFLVTLSSFTLICVAF